MDADEIKIKAELTQIKSRIKNIQEGDSKAKYYYLVCIAAYNFNLKTILNYLGLKNNIAPNRDKNSIYRQEFDIDGHIIQIALNGYFNKYQCADFIFGIRCNDQASADYFINELKKCPTLNQILIYDEFSQPNALNDNDEDEFSGKVLQLAKNRMGKMEEYKQPAIKSDENLKGSDNWQKFLEKYPIEKIEKLTLEEYTSYGSRETFSYHFEFGLLRNYSAAGGTAIKYGIYAHKPTDESDEQYTWSNKNQFKNANEAFLDVRARLIRIIKAAKKRDFYEINKIPFATNVKWKIAFIYQFGNKLPSDLNNFRIIGVTKLDALNEYLIAKGLDTIGNHAEAYQTIIKINNGKYDIFELSDKVWENYVKRNPEDANEEAVIIKNIEKNIEAEIKTNEAKNQTEKATIKLNILTELRYRFWWSIVLLIFCLICMIAFDLYLYNCSGMRSYLFDTLPKKYFLNNFVYEHYYFLYTLLLYFTALLPIVAINYFFIKIIIVNYKLAYDYDHKILSYKVFDKLYPAHNTKDEFKNDTITKVFDIYANRMLESPLKYIDGKENNLVLLDKIPNPLNLFSKSKEKAE